MFERGIRSWPTETIRYNLRKAPFFNGKQKDKIFRESIPKTCMFHMKKNFEHQRRLE